MVRFGIFDRVVNHIMRWHAQNDTRTKIRPSCRYHVTLDGCQFPQVPRMSSNYGMINIMVNPPKTREWMLSSVINNPIWRFLAMNITPFPPHKYFFNWR